MVMRLPVVLREGGSKIIYPLFERLILITPIYSALALSLDNITRLSCCTVFSGSLTSIRNADSLFGFDLVGRVCNLGKSGLLLIIMGDAVLLLLLLFTFMAEDVFLLLLFLLFLLFLFVDDDMFSTIL